MNKIKTYEGFFDIFKKKNYKSKSQEDLKSEILDCFLELQDDGFEVVYITNDKEINVTIENENLFPGDRIVDTLEFATSYIKSELGLEGQIYIPEFRLATKLTKSDENLPEGEAENQPVVPVIVFTDNFLFKGKFDREKIKNIDRIKRVSVKFKL